MVGGVRPHFSKNWGYIIRGDSYFSYNSNPKRKVLLTQSAAGPCCLCRKTAFLKIHFEDERWIDFCQYSLGDDQLFFYKLYRYGNKVLLSTDANITHLDGRGGHGKMDYWEKMFSFAVLRYLLWYRTIYEPSCNGIQRACAWISFFIFKTLRDLPLRLWFLIRYKTIRLFTTESRAHSEAKRIIRDVLSGYPSFLAHCVNKKTI